MNVGKRAGVAGFTRLLVAMLALVLAFAGGAEAQFRKVNPGDKAPDFTLPAVNLGQDVTLSAFEGYAVVVVFVRMGQEKSENVINVIGELDQSVLENTQILAIAINPGDEDPAGWATRVKAKVPVLSDVEGTVYGDWGVYVAPQTGLIGPDGILPMKAPITPR